MSREVILNGSFDYDPSAEKVRISFDKVNTNFAEIWNTNPFVDSDNLTGQAGKVLVVNAGGTAWELATLPGGGDMLSTNNLSELTNTSDARTNLGLGSVSTYDVIDEDDMVSDSATDVPTQQSVKAYVDGNVNTYTAGDGISISGANVITNTETNVNAESGVIDYENERITITLTNDATFNISIPGIKPVIDGYTVDKGAGNTDYETIEVGDKCIGWDGDEHVAFKVNALPYTTAGNVSYATRNSI